VATKERHLNYGLDNLDFHAESVDDAEKEACCWLHRPLLYARDVRLCAAYARGKLRLSDFLLLSRVANHLANAICASLAAELLALGAASLAVKVVKHVIHAVKIVVFLHNIRFFSSIAFLISLLGVFCVFF